MLSAKLILKIECGAKLSHQELF